MATIDGGVVAFALLRAAISEVDDRQENHNDRLSQPSDICRDRRI
jgi:hypothetical protein